MGGRHFAGNRLSSADGGIGVFAQGPFSRLLGVFFRKKAIFEASWAFFSFLKGRFCCLCCHVSWQHCYKVEEVDRRETLRNKGFRSDFAFVYLSTPFDVLKRLDFATFFEDTVFVCYYFVFFKVRNFDKIGFLG